MSERRHDAGRTRVPPHFGGNGIPAPGRIANPAYIAAAILVLHAALVLARLDHFSWRDDEAVLLLTARAWQTGQALYDTVWFNYPPGLMLLLRAAFAVGGYGLLTARAAVLVTATLTLLFTHATARAADGKSRWAGVGAMALLAVAPHYLSLSGAVMAEVPALGLACGAVWAALRYTRSRRLAWLAASGALFGLALLIKPTPIFAGGALALAVGLTERTWGRRLRGWAVLGLAAAVPLFGGILAVNPLGFAHQFGDTYLASKGAFGLDLLANLADLAGYLFDDKYGIPHVGLLVLAGMGLVSLWRRERRAFWVLAAWLALVLLALATHSPLYRHHLLQLLIPLCVLAGVGCGYIGRNGMPARDVRRNSIPSSAVRRNGIPSSKGKRTVSTRAEGRMTHPAYVAIVALLLELALCLRVSLFSLGMIESDQFEIGQQVVAFLRENTPTDSTILTDGHILAVRAGREVPPELTNTARMRIKTGELTDQDVIEIARRDRPAAIVFWEKKLDALDDWATWVACHYDLALKLDERHRVYLRREPISANTIEVPMTVEMGAGIRLRGYDLPSRPVAAGQVLDLTLYWEAVERPGADLTVFVHLLDARGEPIAQHDGAPRDGACPTWIWQPGETLRDHHTLNVERTGAGAPYTLYAGLYDRRSGQRTRANRVTLTQLP